MDNFTPQIALIGSPASNSFELQVIQMPRDAPIASLKETLINPHEFSSLLQFFKVKKLSI
jgi:hypothetical protein